MTARSTPYPPMGFNVRIPDALWAAALDEVRRYATLGGGEGRKGSEGLIYLGGVPTADALVVTSLIRLHHAPQGDSVRPTPEEVRWLLGTLRECDEKLVAQLHTHRFGARHSVGDDRMATSFHDGFLSIVAPNFAIGIDRLDECIVHEYHAGQFRPIPGVELAKRFTVNVQIIDRPHDETRREPKRWRRSAAKVKSIVLRRL